MSEFTKAYKFVSAWLWDCREYGSERRTSGREWDNERCADVADMLKDYTSDLQARIAELEERERRIRVAVIEMHNDNIKGDFELPELARIDLNAIIETINPPEEV